MSHEVYISRRGYLTMIYHTDEDCSRLPDNYRDISLDKLNDTYEECDVCADRYNIGGWGQKQEQDCPFCGETVGQLPDHLPCDGVE